MRSVERDLSEVALVSEFNATLRNFPMVVFCVYELRLIMARLFLTYDL